MMKNPELCGLKLRDSKILNQRAQNHGLAVPSHAYP